MKGLPVMRTITRLVTAAILTVAPIVTLAGTAGAAPAPGTAGLQQTAANTGPDAEQAAFIRTLPAIDETSSGLYVLTLQARLIRAGYDLEGTGYFGPNTKVAVADWQAAHGIRASGHVGVETWTSLLGCNFFTPSGTQPSGIEPGMWFPEGGDGLAQSAVNDLQWIFPRWAEMSTTFTERTRVSDFAQYDDPAVRTVQSLQWRVGLYPSGLIGPETTKALDLIDSVAFTRGYQNGC